MFGGTSLYRRHHKLGPPVALVAIIDRIDDNENMGMILSFFSENNALIIKMLSIVVAVAATVLLYRVIFVQNVEVIGQPVATDSIEVSKRVNEQKIEIESLKSETETTKIELEKQRTEVYNLRQTLKEKETEVETVKTELLQAKSATDESKKLDYEKHTSEVILSTADENLVFQKEISELKRRLSDYEIIAEDISDMQKLKDENEKLKKLIASGATVESIESAAEDPDAMIQSNASNASNAPIAIPVLEAPEKVDSIEVNMQDVADLVASVADNQKIPVTEKAAAPEAASERAAELAETAKAMVVETETLEPVSEVDKNLMEKFEKQKET